MVMAAVNIIQQFRLIAEKLCIVIHNFAVIKIELRQIFTIKRRVSAFRKGTTIWLREKYKIRWLFHVLPGVSVPLA